jgi:hypothetical protein
LHFVRALHKRQACLAELGGLTGQHCATLEAIISGFA